jgi:hypothetical protein
MVLESYGKNTSGWRIVGHFDGCFVIGRNFTA